MTSKAGRTLFYRNTTAVGSHTIVIWQEVMAEKLKTPAPVSNNTLYKCILFIESVHSMKLIDDKDDYIDEIS